MTEWRRTLRSWPKETVKIVEPASLPEWVREAARARRDEGAIGREKRLGLVLLLFFVPFYLFLVFLPTDDPRTWALLGCLVGSIFLSLLFSGSILERAERRRRNRATERLEALGESTLGGDFVGVGYSNECWTYGAIGRYLDQGVLRLDLDRLTFVGRDSRFELPADAIVGTEIRQHQGEVGARARLYVHWAYGGKAGTLSLELPYRRTMRQRVQEIVDLRDRIERWRNEPFPRRTALPVLPLTVAAQKKINPYSKVGLTAKLLAGFTLVLGQIFLTVGGDVGLRWAGYPQLGHKLLGSSGVLYGLGWILWLLLAAKIEPWLPKRFRYRPKDEDTLRDTLRGTEAAVIVEPVIDARLKQ